MKKVIFNKKKVKRDWPASSLAAVSCWVSAKRTRSKPFSRVLRMLYQKDMKKITIIPVVKDEGKDGDRDYWMTSQEALDYGMIDEVLINNK